MSIRPALPSDLPAITHVCQTCLPGDGRSKFLNPHRHTYPTDYALYLLSNPRKKLLHEDPNIAHNIVIELPTGEIVGWALWRRNLSSLKPSTPAHLLPDPENRASSPDRERRVMKAVGYDKKKFFNVDHWYLSMLGVLPEHRRRGYGKLMCLWGMKRAREDGVPCMLTSSEEGEKLYKEIGWKRVGFRAQPDMEGLDIEEVMEDCGRDSNVFVPLPVMKWGEDGEGYEDLDRLVEVVKEEQ